MNFGPLLESCVPLKMFRLGEGLEGFLLHENKSRGEIEYLFLFGVFKDQLPLLYYGAEKTPNSKNIFIGVFDENGHKNLGIDNQCDDSMSFLMKALEYVCENFKIDRSQIQEIPAQSK